MRSAAETEVSGLYMQLLEALLMRTTLEELDHPQPATPMRRDNSTADGIIDKAINQRQIKKNGQEILMVTKLS